MNGQSPAIRQRGAIGFSAIAFLLSVLLLAALAIDTARLTMAKRHLQAQADLAALSMSRQVCYLDGVNNRDALLEAAQANLAANGFQGVSQIDFGEASIAGNHWQFTPNASAARQGAARVELRQTLPASLLAGGLVGRDVTLVTRATVYKRLDIGYRLGSGTIDVSMTNALLSTLTGSSVSLLSYDGIANVDLTLGQLLGALGQDSGAELTLGDVDSLLQSEITLGQLLEAMTQVLSRDDSASAAVTLLGQLRNGARVPSLSLALGQILTLADQQSGSSGDDSAQTAAALATTLNVQNIVTAALLAANQDSALALQNLSTDLGIAGLGITMTVVQPPQYQIGHFPLAQDEEAPRVETAQVTLTLQASLLPTGLNLGLLTLNPVAIGLQVQAGKAEAAITDARGCSLESGIDLDVAVTPSLLNVKVGQPAAPATPLAIGGTVLGQPVRVDVAVAVPVAPAAGITQTLHVQQTPLPYTTRIAAPLSESLGDAAEHLTVETSLTVLGLPVSSLVLAPILTALDTTLEPLVADVTRTLVQQAADPLLHALGIDTGYADVTIESIDTGRDALIR